MDVMSLLLNKSDLIWIIIKKNLNPICRSCTVSIRGDCIIKDRRIDHKNLNQLIILQNRLFLNQMQNYKSVLEKFEID
jgi:hypothetical protein